jgi:hypothetical protein
MKLTKERQGMVMVMNALAEIGIVSTAFEFAGTSWNRVYEPRKRDTAIAEPRGEFDEWTADVL